jgi:hypothetical protein
MMNARTGQAVRLGAALLMAAALVVLVYRILFYAWMSATPEEGAGDWGLRALRDGALSVAIVAACAVWSWRLRQTRSRDCSPKGARSQPRP